MSSTPRYLPEAIVSWAVSYVPRCRSRRCCYYCSVSSRSCPTVRSTHARWPTTLPAVWNRCYAIRTDHHQSSDVVDYPERSRFHFPILLTLFLIASAILAL
uniref:Uncharacterized protein n=1 Tax=Anopheles maculatus TaxID=74869 RepID=A0A182SRW6_9DIPT